MDPNIDYDKMAEAMVRAQKSVGPNFGGDSFSPKTKESFGIFDAALVTAGGSLGKAAEAVKLLNGAITQYEADWQKASNVGVSFNNNIVGLSTAIAQTRLNTQEFFGALQAGRDGLKINVTALGGTLSEATKNFANLSKDFTTNFGDPLKYMGYNAQEYNEVLALTITNQKGFNAESKDPEARAIRERSLIAAADLAGEMDKMAKLTGVSREAQRQRALEDSQDGQLQAKLTLLQQQSGRDLSVAFKKLTSDMSFGGKAIQDTAKNIYNGGELTQQSQSVLQAMGPAAAEFTAAIRESQRATAYGTAEEQRAAQSRIEALAPLVTNAIRQSGNLTFLSTNVSNDIAKTGQQLLISTNMYSKGLEAAQKEVVDHKDALHGMTAQQLLSTRAEAEQRGKEYVYDEVKKEYVERTKEGTDTTKALIQTQARAADMEAKLAEGINALNNTISKSDLVKNIINSTKNVQTDTSGNRTTGLDRAGLLGTTGLTDIIAGITKGDYKAVIEGVGKTGKDVLTTIGDFAITAMKGMIEPVTTVGNSLNNKTGTRDGGTLKETGSPIEQEDSIVKIHKGETVFSPESTKNLGAQIQQMAENSLQMPFVTGAYKPTQTTLTNNQTGKDKASALAQQNEVKEPTSKPPYPAELQKLVDVFKKNGGLDSDQMKQMGSFGNLGTKAYNESLSAVLNKQETVQAKETAQTTVASDTEKLKAEAKKKEEELKRQAEAAPPGEASYTPTAKTTASSPTITATASTTLDDLKKQLEMLNKSMGILVSETHALVDHTDRQVRATKRLDPNVNTRG